MFEKIFSFFRRVSSEHDANSPAAAVEALAARIDALVQISEKNHQVLAHHLNLQSAHLFRIAGHVARAERQSTLSHARFASPLRLEPHGYQVYSQYDEDGIIAEIFRRIGTASKKFVEVAAGDGAENCTRALLEQGWTGLWVECDSSNIAKIGALHRARIDSGQLKVSAEFITCETINSVIDNADIGDEIDLIVIDIDGNDYHVIEVLEARPRVFCVEYFPRLPPPHLWVMERNDAFRWDGDLPIGASLASYEALLSRLGYKLVGTSLAGINAFFVRSDLVKDNFHAPFTATNHYNPARYFYGRHPFEFAAWPNSSLEHNDD